MFGDEIYVLTVIIRLMKASPSLKYNPDHNYYVQFSLWQLATSGGDQTLSDIDDSLVRAGVFLKDIAKNQRKVDCLNTFARCKDIMKWLQKETKGDTHNMVVTF